MRNFWQFLALWGLLLAPNIEANLSEKGSSWLEVELGIVGSASDDILKTALKRVSEEQLEGLFIILDTPGGSLEATRSMVKAIMGSKRPVVVWVGPAGARAGSAGAFLTMAAHVAVMAKGTNIGAAHPVGAGGQDIEGDVRKKIENDTAAFMESIAVARKRNKEMAISFVVNSVSITATEALEFNIIDYIANDKKAVLAGLDGRTIVLGGDKKTVIQTGSVKLIKYKKNIREKFLEILSNPNLFYLLFVAGLIGIGFELTHPGVMLPGVLGGISLILALIATSVLPVSFGAMLLILVSIAFMIAEVFLPSFGILGIGGFAAFIIGSILLVDPANEQGLRIHWLTILPGAIAVAGFGVFVSYLVMRSEKSRVKSGAEAMVGNRGVVCMPFKHGKGKVRVSGEIWNARERDGTDLNTGDPITILELQGLELVVEAEGESQTT